ncbi:hypothetical protein HDU67_009722 [Dinochytrium kinnereticum]|nr:hypothetical protein HDU67_009722 [Dinochytrium kinnereticum]
MNDDDTMRSEKVPLLNDEPVRRNPHRAVSLKAVLAGVAAVAAVGLAYTIAKPWTLRTLHAGTSPFLTDVFGWPKTQVPPAPLTNVTYDHRSIIVNGKRELLFTGTIHYPRSSTAMWPVLLERSKAAGINAIDTYVFWNLHEPEEGVYDFESDNGNLTLFLENAKEAGLYVVLRIGPYVCAEWTFGGFPFWLMEKPGMELRNFNADFMHYMEGFVRKTLDVVKPYLATNGGPIILLQMENEFGAIEAENGINGHRYITWAADLANSLNVGLPWIMCVQDNMPTVINTGNGFYADNWIAPHWKRFYDQPAMFTELWTGWFQQWTQPKWTRPAEDVAFSSARFIARGGSYVAYYMWHGGTNFGRWGSGWKTASYDYDAPMNEYGFPANPKFNHLRELHLVCQEYADLILSNDPVVVATGGTTEAHVYENGKKRSIIFLSNYNVENDATVNFNGNEFVLPKWSVSIYVQTENGLSLRYRTSSASPAIDGAASLPDRPEKAAKTFSALPHKISFIREPIGAPSSKGDILSDAPLEQFRTTRDKSDYLWYIRPNITLPRGLQNAASHSLRFTRFHDVISVWLDGSQIIGGVHSVLTGDVGSVKVESTGSVTVEVPDHLVRSGEEDGKETQHTLAILSSVTGIENCCGHLERVEKGILGAVYVDEKDVTFGADWHHKVGLWGEAEELWSSKSTQTWKSSIPKEKTPMIWYRLKFSKKTLRSLSEEAETLARTNLHSPSSSKLLTSFSLFLGTMGRGMAYVNGRGIGRHWSVNAGRTDRCEKACSASGPFWAEKCPEGCGVPSQTWYHVPADWVFDGEGDDVDVVVFEEKGGDPTGIHFTALAG